MAPQALEQRLSQSRSIEEAAASFEQTMAAVFAAADVHGVAAIDVIRAFRGEITGLVEDLRAHGQEIPEILANAFEIVRSLEVVDQLAIWREDMTTLWSDLGTMAVDAESRKDALRSQSEQDGPAFKLKNDPRVTRIGGLLRRTSIDELPQLWNVLRGDMSLVGPRPLPVIESDGCLRWQRRRLAVTPGLTCIWQVSGRSRVTFNEWMRMDLQYVRRRSFWTDIKLIFSTIPSVLLRRGAH